MNQEYTYFCKWQRRFFCEIRGGIEVHRSLPRNGCPQHTVQRYSRRDVATLRDLFTISINSIKVLIAPTIITIEVASDHEIVVK